MNCGIRLTKSFSNYHLLIDEVTIFYLVLNFFPLAIYIFLLLLVTFTSSVHLGR